MAKAAAPEETTDLGEIINQGQFIERLGINQVVWAKHPEYRQWLEQQPGVVYEARKSFIPASLVPVLRVEFDVQPVQKRTRKAKNASKTAELDYTSLSAADLLNHKSKEEALIADGVSYDEAIQEARNLLSELEEKQEAAQGASNRLDRINKAIAQKKEALEEKRRSLAEEEELLDSI